MIEVYLPLSNIIALLQFFLLFSGPFELNVSTILQQAGNDLRRLETKSKEFQNDMQLKSYS